MNAFSLWTLNYFKKIRYLTAIETDLERFDAQVCAQEHGEHLHRRVEAVDQPADEPPGQSAGGRVRVQAQTAKASAKLKVGSAARRRRAGPVQERRGVELCHRAGRHGGEGPQVAAAQPQRVCCHGGGGT